MFVSLVFVLSAIVFPLSIPKTPAAYFISPLQLRYAQALAAAGTAKGFDTPSQAAYAASLRYATAIPSGEAGAKIYMDTDGARIAYSYGPRLSSDVDQQTAADEIVYDDRATDGHSAVVGVWHEHAVGSTWLDLYGHYDAIAATHQSIWTTIGQDFYVQFWDGSAVEPAWQSSAPAIAPLCQGCE
jgi:hypothetical protein